ncbi:MAG: hypothetical protein B6I38_09230 [Anaerolineaceae bacterium 4572_5.1]|nr:MAG: hypothetical protein B6I38_09230 [Anaerolineaceae bacterium 4572_5.1]
MLFPREHRRKIRANNITERLNREIRRRARVVSISPNSASYLRLVSTILNETSEKWITGRAFPEIKLSNSLLTPVQKPSFSEKQMKNLPLCHHSATI